MDKSKYGQIIMLIESYNGAMESNRDYYCKEINRHPADFWALGLVEDISDASNICDCNYAIKLFNESNSYEDFKSKCKLREVNEILDMLDLYYRYHWACVEKRIKPETSIGNLNSSVVIERRRGLEWIIREIQDWYDISLDT